MRVRWEYCSIEFTPGRYTIYYQKADSESQEVQSLAEAFEKLGNDEWELVSIIHDPDLPHGETFYFKRPT